MSAAWDGRPEQPERTRPHELWNLPHNGGNGPMFWTWDADAQLWTLGFYMKHPEEAAKAWRYVGPCLTPAEVAAREAAAERRGIERAAKVCADKSKDAYREAQTYATKEDGGDGSREDCLVEALANIDCAAAIRALLVEGER